MKFSPLLLLFFGVFNLNAQTAPEVANDLISINVLTPGLEYETGITDNSTLDFRFGLGFALVGGELRGGTDFGIFPNFSAQYRRYYNLAKRLEKGKNISRNSGNYLALHSSIYSGKPIFGDLEFESDYSVEVGPVWGLQRVYGKGFKLDLNLGAGFGFNEIGDTYISPLIGFRLGWVILD